MRNNRILCVWLFIAFIFFLILIIARSAYAHIDWIDTTAGVEVEVQRMEKEMESDSIDNLRNEVDKTLRREAIEKDVNESIDFVYIEMKDVYEAL